MNSVLGSGNPTSNLFFTKVYRIKMVLDKNYELEEDWLKEMISNMKQEFDKYWDECNLLMAIGGVEFIYHKIFPSNKASDHVLQVKNSVKELFNEYVPEYCTAMDEHANRETPSGSVQSQKSKLDIYLEEGCYICDGDANSFDALKCWSANNLKFWVLSTMAIDIPWLQRLLLVPGAGGLIDSCRASLSSETVKVLLCRVDWCRILHGVKKKREVNKGERIEEVILPIPRYRVEVGRLMSRLNILVRVQVKYFTLLRESSNQDLPSPIGEDEVEDTTSKEEDNVKEEKESPCHEDATGDLRATPLSEPGEDDLDPLNESDEEPNKEAEEEPKRDSDFEEENASKESKPRGTHQGV
ncbi:hypothetical protein Cgig2_020584 [Carnegiea gigantea]|uniref:hAT-like transposase RNase-H fold domain-containing protein n=1 Tax=Carnegiea gigantea TaxID=171969 RepID=A0A9Q1JW98_9CARY|nr:hypothetical protein Cgig2_020584 [Carnegiea gigantea]